MTSSKGQDRPPIQIQLLAELPVDLVHVAVELFEQALEAIEHGIEGGLVTGEVGADEILKFLGIAVFRPPEFGYLMQATRKAQALRCRRTWQPVPLPACWRRLAPRTVRWM